MTIRKSTILILALFALAAFGCAPKPAADPGSTACADYQSYLNVQKEWTRDAKIYKLFDTELIVQSTYYSKAYRDALRTEKARAEKLLPTQIAQLAKKDAEELAATAKFLVSAYTTKSSSNNLDEKKPSFRLWLLDAKGRQVAPLRIKAVKMRLEADRRYLPYINDWSKTYEVDFPLADESGTKLALTGGDIALVVAGIQGAARMEWHIP